MSHKRSTGKYSGSRKARKSTKTSKVKSSKKMGKRAKKQLARQIEITQPDMLSGYQLSRSPEMTDIPSLGKKMKLVKMSDVKSELRHIGNRMEERAPNIAKYYKWYALKGKTMKGRKLTSKEETELGILCNLYKPKQCFYNSQLVAITTNKGYTYYEGYATNSKLSFAFSHGWLVKDGKVVDATWKDGIKYFGIPIPKEVVRSHVLTSGRAERILPYYFVDTQI